MKPRFTLVICFALILTCAAVANAQHIARITPPDIKLRGIGLGDYSHAMAVGDSATILISREAEYDVQSTYFTLQPPCDRSHTFYGISYYDTTHAVIIADAGLIFTTSDAGSHWTQSGAGITGQTLRGIAHTTKGSLIVVGDSGLILRSNDSGTSWTRVTSSTIYNINGIAINSGGRGYFVGAHGLIGRTTDYGVTWPTVTDTTTNIGGNRGLINFHGVAISDANYVWAVGDSGAFARSTNGTVLKAFRMTASNFPNDTASTAYANWTLQRSSFSGVMYCGIPTSQIQWFVWGDHDWMLFINNGGSYNSVYAPGSSGDADGDFDRLSWRMLCGSVWNGSPKTTVVFAGARQAIWQSSDSLNGGWGFVTDSLTFSQFLSISFDSIGNGFAICNGGTALTSTDNGFIWKVYYPLLFQTTTSSIPSQPTDIHTIDSNNAIAVGWAGIVYRTSDGGITWDSTQIDPSLDNLHSIASPAKSVYLVCGDYGTMFRSTDGGQTWSTPNISSTAFLQTVAFSTSSIGVTAGSSGTILRTTNQGITWTNVPNPLTGSSTSYKKLQAFPNGTYYATTDSSGLFRSTDQGQNWSVVAAVKRTMGMGFYNERIGVVAEYGWCDSLHLVRDTARFAFSNDGFTSPPLEFNVPILNNNRMPFHFLDSNSFLCYGLQGDIVKVDMSKSGVHITKLSPASTTLHAYPNPSGSRSRTFEYDLDHSGLMSIELWNVRGERVQTLFEGIQEIGHHTQHMNISQSLHGTFFVRLLSGSQAETVSIVVE